MASLDVLLIRPNDMKAVYGGVSEVAACEPPFWAGVIASYCRECGFTAGILDAEVYNYSPEEVCKLVKEQQPQLIGIVVTGTNLSASTQKMQGAGHLAGIIKKSSNIPIFMWGLHPSALPERTMQEEDIDFVIKGEGLPSIAGLVGFVKGNLVDLPSMKGLYYKRNGKVEGNPEITLVKGEELPEPAWDLMPMHLYRAHNWHRFGEQGKEKKGYAVIATSLGCPFSCSFCAVSALFGKKCVRYVEPERVVRMIGHLVEEYGVKYIKILDETFVLNMEHVEKICDLLIERKYGLNIWAYARVDTINENILGKLYQAGIKWLAFGIESASELSLGDVKKGHYGIEQIKSAVQMTKKAGINVMANFMFGLPEDTKESMEMTLNLARELNPEYINMYCTMAYPGSKLYLDTEKKHPEYLPMKWISYAQFSYECYPMPTNYIPAEDVLQFRDYAFQAFFQGNKAYFDNIREKFGESTVESIQKMLSHKLKRKILEGRNEE